MDIITFALCKKMSGGGGVSSELQQEINSLKESVTQLENNQTVQQEKIQEVQVELSKKVSARIVTK